MTKQTFTLLATLLLLTSFVSVFGQTVPRVELAFDPPQAALGDTVTAKVWVRNGQNIAGADVGIVVDDCLRIIGRTQSTYLPNSSNGGFTVYESLSDHRTRLAVALIDRSKVTSTDGIFYSVEMEVLCEGRSADVNVYFGELSAYNHAQPIPLTAHRLSNGTLTATNAQLHIFPSGNATIPLPYAGWHSVNWPAQTRSVAAGLQSIDGQYTTIWRFNGDGSNPRWSLYDTRIPYPFSQFLNTLSDMQYGRDHWLRITEPTQLVVSYAANGNPNAATHTANRTSTTLPPPPAAIYGAYNGTAGETITALVNGSPCGEATAIEWNGETYYAIYVESASTAFPNCASEGDTVVLNVDGITVAETLFAPEEPVEVEAADPSAVTLANNSTRNSATTPMLLIVTLLGLLTIRIVIRLR